MLDHCFYNVSIYLCWVVLWFRQIVTSMLNQWLCFWVNTLPAKRHLSNICWKAVIQVRHEILYLLCWEYKVLSQSSRRFPWVREWGMRSPPSPHAPLTYQSFTPTLNRGPFLCLEHEHLILIQFSFPFYSLLVGAHIGPEPTTDRFVVVMVSAFFKYVLPLWKQHVDEIKPFDNFCFADSEQIVLLVTSIVSLTFYAWLIISI